jgi:hypothetical protein
MPKLVEIWNGKAEKSQNALSPAPVTKETESLTSIAEIKSKKANGEDITKRKQKWVNEAAEIVYAIVQQVGRNGKPGMTLEELREWCMAAMSSIPRGYRDSVAGLVAQRLWAIAQYVDLSTKYRGHGQDEEEDLNVKEADIHSDGDELSLANISHSNIFENQIEPLRPGDVILYTHPIFKHGDKRGERVTTVLATDPDATKMLTLDNDEVLPYDHFVARIKVMDTKSGERRDHHGDYRPIEFFRMRKRKLDDNKTESVMLTEGVQGAARRIKAAFEKDKADLAERVWL